MIRYILVVCCLVTSAFAADTKLSFKEGATFHVTAIEQLKITMQFSQVDSALVEPSIRITEYHFTETVEKVHSDGSASIAATLDSFYTKIYLVKVADPNEYFRFNSTNDYDIQNRLKDIRALPRAQFLGQTLRYTIGSDGLIRSFVNLKDFQMATIGRAYEYDMMQAMLSFADSLRVGQLLEQGAGALAAADSTATLPYTFTEIKLDRQITATKKPGGALSFEGTFTNVPRSIDYLEGIATHMEIENFRARMKGEVRMTGGIITHQSISEAGNMVLKFDVESVKHDVERTFTLTREPVKVLRGATVKIEEKERHKAEWKAPEPDPDMIRIDANTGKMIYPEEKQDTTVVDSQ